MNAFLFKPQPTHQETLLMGTIRMRDTKKKMRINIQIRIIFIVAPKKAAKQEFFLCSYRRSKCY